jgi:exonuclease SbcC
MRLHSLDATAFGPFADTVSVDFDSLSEAGLFLLTGPTGAGKTSVLDAVCFALYGDVPGDRASAKRLRSDLAVDGVAPQVVLVATLGDRRFRITRSPAWQRPKRRGNGLTTQQASVVVEELTVDGPRLLTTRLDEAGHLVSGLLGMNLGQFCQVAMLPQGRFQEFLRARSEDRHRLLQQLFRTRRFEEVERWLRDHRLDLRRQLEARSAVLATLAHRIDEAAEGRTLLDHALLEDDAALDAWAADAVADARARAAVVGDLAAVALAAAQAAETARGEGTALATLQSRHHEALRTQAALLESADDVARLQARIDDARRAAPVRPLHEIAVRARTRRAEADCRLAELVQRPAAFARRTPDLEAADRAAVARQLEETRDTVARIPTLLSLESEYDGLQHRGAELDREAGRLVLLESELASRADRLPQKLAGTAEALAAATEARHTLPAARSDVEAARLSHSAAVELAAIRLAHTEATERLRAFVDTHQGCREHWLQLHEARLHGMAAEIATDLAVGASCPVCGSCDHPRRAQPAPDAPTQDAEKDARRAVDDAEIARQAQADVVRGLDTRIAVLTEQCAGVDIATASAHLQAARLHLDHVEPLARAWETLSAELAAAEADRDRIHTDLATARLERATLEVERQTTGQRLTELSEVLAATLDEGQTVAQLAATLQAGLAWLTALVDAHETLESMLEAESEAAADLIEAALAHGFATPGAAVDALVPDDTLRRDEAHLLAHQERVAATQATLDDPEVRTAAEQPSPDLAALGRAHTMASTQARAAQSTSDRAAERLSRVTGLQAELARELAGWRPLRSAYQLAQQVAAFAEGKAADNRDQMRLSAYVLAWRLGQVVDAANARLGAMTDQRFALEHTTRRGAGETRGGLSLLVRDAWSGESRDPVTLSGGETFVVSLALALGLTDVVTQEAGGADIGTLFVDEGFGSLDADTLDDVMDTLDGLRDGGRAVGIVSHVPELRTRIPTQLRVTKGRSGSRVHQAHEPG